MTTIEASDPWTRIDITNSFAASRPPPYSRSCLSRWLTPRLAAASPWHSPLPSFFFLSLSLVLNRQSTERSEQQQQQRRQRRRRRRRVNRGREIRRARPRSWERKRKKWERFSKRAYTFNIVYRHIVHHRTSSNVVRSIMKRTDPVKPSFVLLWAQLNRRKSSFDSKRLCY